MSSLSALLKSGFGRADGYSPAEAEKYGGVNMNCCERILRGANEAYGLGLREADMRLAAPFGGGMAIGSVCGAVTGSLMVLGLLYAGKLEKATALKTEVTKPFLNKVRKKLGGLTCAYNKGKYATKNPFDCSYVINALAECLDEVRAKQQ